MPHYRAHHATAAAARDAVAAARTATEARWSTATEATGIDVGTVSPTVAVRVESTEDIPATATLPETYSNAKMRITAIDGRGEYATGTMPKTQADTLISAASGTVLAATVYMSQIRVTARLAKSVQIVALDLTAAVLDGLILQDLNTGKQYTCGTYTASAAGVHTVPVTETDSTDTSDVTFGTPLTLLAPPSNIVAYAQVNAMKGFSFVALEPMTDVDGRAYWTRGTTTLADSGISLSGNHSVIASVSRNDTDGLDVTYSLTVGDDITFDSAPTGVAVTAVVTRTGGATVEEGTELYYDDGPTRYFYEVTQTTEVTDLLYADVPFKANILGGTANRDVADVMTFTTPPTNIDATAAASTVVAAQVYPQPFLAQVVGGKVEWETRIYPTGDGRWASELYTIPPGS